MEYTSTYTRGGDSQISLGMSTIILCSAMVSIILSSVSNLSTLRKRNERTIIMLLWPQINCAYIPDMIIGCDQF